MSRRRWKAVVIAVCAVSLLVVAYDRLWAIYWVGSTDLEIEFVITEAGSGAPVRDARIEIQSDGGFYEERDKQEFALVTDLDGVARKVCVDSICFGSRSGLGFTDTFVVHLPYWRYQVIADGYAPREWVSLNVPERVDEVRRIDPRKAKSWGLMRIKTASTVSLGRRNSSAERPSR
jgi:hypothetical protein